MRLAVIAASLACATVLAQPLPPVAPDQAGFSAEGLARIDRFFAREIEANRVPGAVIAAARFIPGVCAVFGSSSLPCTTRTPWNFHFEISLMVVRFVVELNG